MTNQGFEDEQLLFKVIDQDRAEPMIVKAATPEVHEHLFYFMFIYLLCLFFIYYHQIKAQWLAVSKQAAEEMGL